MHNPVSASERMVRVVFDSEPKRAQDDAVMSVYIFPGCSLKLLALDEFCWNSLLLIDLVCISFLRGKPSARMTDKPPRGLV